MQQDDHHHFLEEMPSIVQQPHQVNFIRIQSLLTAAHDSPFLTMQFIHVTERLLHLMISLEQSSEAAESGQKYLDASDNLSDIIDGLEKLLSVFSGSGIDDKACYMESRRSEGIDILGRLPPELSLYILAHTNLPEVLSCLRVSRHYNRIASDPLVWRAIYFRAGFQIDSQAIRQIPTNSPYLLSRAHYTLSPASSILTIPTIRRTLMTPSSPPMSAFSRTAHFIPSYPSSSRNSVSSSNNHGSSESNNRPVRRDLTISAGPLSLDWRMLYKIRLEVENRLSIPEPKRTEIIGHKDAVYCAEYDGSKIVTGSKDKTICVWSFKDGKSKLQQTFRGHTASVLCLQFDSTGFMVSGSSDCSVRVWDLNKEEANACVMILDVHTDAVLDIKMDNKWIVSCSKDRCIQIHDRATLKHHRRLSGHLSSVNALGLQNDKVASVSGDKKMILWDISTGERIRTFEGHERGLACVVFKGDTLITGSSDKKIKVWDVLTGECTKTLSGHLNLVRSLSYDPVTTRLISASYDRSIRIWDVGTGKYREFANVHESYIFDVVARVGKVISASHDGKVVIMDFAGDLDTSLFA